MGIKKDLLDRVVLIQLAVTGIKWAVPRLFMPIQATGPFPGFANGLNRSTFNRSAGAGYLQETVRLTMRLVAGSLTSGQIGEREDLANTLYDTVQDAFEGRAALQHPATNEAFRYLEAANGAYLTEIIMGRPLAYMDGTQYLAADFILEARLLYPITRIAGS